MSAAIFDAPRRLTLTVGAEWDGNPVDALLRQALCLSGTVIKRAKRIENGITLDGAHCTSRDIARAGQVLSVLVGDLPGEVGLIAPKDGPLDVVYEDGDLLILNKPAGIPVHPGPGHEGGTIGNFVVSHLLRRGEGGVLRPVNRLDRGTSGLMAVAKHAHAHERLKEQLHSPDFVRTYLAVCEGVPSPAAGVIDAPIAKGDGATIRREVRPDGQEARTRYRVLREADGRALAELVLETGRTHQIRVHMAHIGHPLTGDFLYGTEDKALIGRPALHAAGLALTHPVTGERLTFKTPLPEDIEYLMGGK